MKLTLDTDTQQLTLDRGQGPQQFNLHTREAFTALSDVWLTTGWGLKYSYRFTWMGRPFIQLPEDVLRLQEALWHVQPDVIVETGIAHGGGLIFYASLMAARGIAPAGQVVGIDIDIRAHNREAITSHPLAPYITLIEGSSTDPDVLDRVRAHIQPDDRVIVVLDSDHSKGHVAGELQAYAPLVTPGSYLVATDGIMKDLANAPGGEDDWSWNHPTAAAAEFADARSDFELVELAPVFDESDGLPELTYWPGAWLKKV